GIILCIKIYDFIPWGETFPTWKNNDCSYLVIYIVINNRPRTPFRYIIGTGCYKRGAGSIQHSNKIKHLIYSPLQRTSTFFIKTVGRIKINDLSL
ncbi:MAG: hypothetical protein WDA37_12500, partial [Dysgonamonadaceae bacterium]